MVPSINQIIVNQSVVFGCDWIDWKPQTYWNWLYLDSKTVAMVASPCSLLSPIQFHGMGHRNIIESEGFIAIQTHVAHVADIPCVFLCFSPCFGQFSMCFWWPEKPSASIGAIVHQAARRSEDQFHGTANAGGVGVHGNKNFPCWNSPIVWSQSYVISFPTSSMVDVGEGLLFLAGWDGMNGVWSQIMPVLGYPSLDLYTAVAEKTPTST